MVGISEKDEATHQRKKDKRLNMNYSTTGQVNAAANK